MNADEIFARCAERRRAVADLIESLDEEQLGTPSLCTGWDVRTVAGHLLVPLTLSPGQVGVAVLRNRGSFPRANAALAVEVGRRGADELARLLRERATSRFTPPLHGPAAPLTDLAAHTADMRVPLGMGHDIRPDEAAVSFDLLTGRSMFFVPRGLLAGIRIAPDDADRSWGDGAELTGSSGDVLLAVLGRRGFLERTAGPGRDLLAARAG